MTEPGKRGAGPVRMAQYGTRHGHAAGILAALHGCPGIALTGVYEPDPVRREALATGGAPPWDTVPRWYADPAELLGDPGVEAVAAEGLNRESLGHARRIVEAGKHLLYDKPAGDDRAEFARVAELARERGLVLQLGYMFRYHDGFQRIAGWARDGTLGAVTSVRAHMSTDLTAAAGAVVAHHRGGVLFDLGGHMVDQIVWLLGRPQRATSYLRYGVSGTPGLADNTLAVLEYPTALAFVDICAVEAPPVARRFEVYGTAGSAIMEPFEPAGHVRLCLRRPAGGYAAGVTRVPVEDRPRYDAMVAAFARAVRGESPPDRDLAHELMVQETLLAVAG